MSLRLYLDHHVPVAIAEGLRQRSVDVVTAAEDGTADWEDEQILQRATDLDGAVFAQDRDFLILAHEWHETGRDLPAWFMRISFGSRSARPL